MAGHAPHGTRAFRVALDDDRHADARRLGHAQRALETASKQRWLDKHTPSGDRDARALAEWVGAAQAELGGRVFRIPNEALGPLRARIEALDRRASRLGVAPIRLADTGQQDPDGHAFVVLQGAAPVLAGWTLAAIVDHRGDGVSVRSVGEPGDRLDPQAFATGRCEHCELRRRRTTTFVVVHADSGEVRQVGSACLRDFLGGHNPERACQQAEYLALARTELRDAEAPPSPQEAPLEAFAAHAARVVRAHGFISREQAQDARCRSSADLALRSLLDTPDAPDRGDHALAAGALRWARALPTLKNELSEFEQDAVAVVHAGSVSTRRERGLLCALISAYRRRRARSRHVFEPGERVHTVVLVERVTRGPSARYGTVHRYELIDGHVNRLVWWQTQGRPLHAGEVVALTGKIERHTRFGTGAVTVLSHCTTETLAGPEAVQVAGT
ncbi:MAG: hypothetical protein JO168_24520 [Solirubrobacterales bacterium]|nr:hypothetical protein [Solirubrobacterales bacterium]